MPVEEAKVYIQAYKGSVHVDKTRHKQQGDKMWVWLAATIKLFFYVQRAGYPMLNVCITSLSKH